MLCVVLQDGKSTMGPERERESSVNKKRPLQARGPESLPIPRTHIKSREDLHLPITSALWGKKGGDGETPRTHKGPASPSPKSELCVQGKTPSQGSNVEND